MQIYERDLEIVQGDKKRVFNRLDNLRAVTRKENQNNPLTIKHNSDAHKGKPSWNKGKKCPQFSGEKNPNSKPVNQIDKKTGQVIKTWPCMMEVKKVLGIDHSSISMCCSGKRKSAGGYIWRYA